MYQKNFGILALLVILFACNNQPSSVDEALDKAGNNREELTKVIEHYKSIGDKEKLKAAYFLIENMPDYFQYQGTILDNYNNFLNEIDSINLPRLDTIFESYQKKFGVLDKGNLDKIYDIQSIKSDYLISNIDAAFKVWKEQPWGKDISFDTFCEYILPYRIEDEKIECWRDSLYTLYNGILDSVRSVKGNSVMACTKINRTLKKQIKGIEMYTGNFPGLTAKEISKVGYVTCREQSHLAIFVMRSLGIPVSIDYTPQWPFRNLGHTWNSVYEDDNHTIHFMGTESAPGEPHKEDHKKAKVYRKTFSKNINSLAILKKKYEKIPSQFEDSHYIDVTEKYVSAKNIIVDILPEYYKASENYIYICVFDNQNWVPIHWAINTKDRVVFEKMGIDIAYIAMYYTSDGLVPASSPFIVAKDGKVNYLLPKKDLTNLILKRKYAFINKWFYERCVNARFQGANKPDFTDAIDLYKIKDTIYTNKTIEVKCVEKFRYVRYITAKGGQGNIAELEFFGSNGVELKGKIIGTEGSWRDMKDRTKEKAFDKNTMTFFDAPTPDIGWVGLDLGKKTEISKINFWPRNDGNSVETGDFYELVYWDKKWISLGKKVALADSVIFNNVPENSLFLLHDLTKGQEERIFTYKKNKQIWW